MPVVDLAGMCRSTISMLQSSRATSSIVCQIAEDGSFSLIKDFTQEQDETDSQPDLNPFYSASVLVLKTRGIFKIVLLF